MAIRLGILGCGWVVQKGYLPHLTRRQNLFRVTAVCDPDAGQMDRVCNEAGGIRKCADVNELLVASEAVLIASPNRFHLQHTRAAMAQGCHALVEKPAFLSAGHVHAVESDWKNTRSCYMPAAVCRYRRDVAILADFCRQIGPVQRLELTWRRRSGVPGRAWHLEPADGWTGVLSDLGFHLIDLISFIVPDLSDGLHVPIDVIDVEMRRGGAIRTGDWYAGNAAQINCKVPFSVKANLTLGFVPVTLHVSWMDDLPGDLTRIKAFGPLGMAELEGVFGYSPDRAVPQQRVALWDPQRSAVRQQVDLPIGPGLHQSAFGGVLNGFYDAIHQQTTPNFREFNFTARLFSSIVEA